MVFHLRPSQQTGWQSRLVRALANFDGYRNQGQSYRGSNAEVSRHVRQQGRCSGPTMQTGNLHKD